MDLVDWSRERFDEIRKDFIAFAAKLQVRDIHFIPMSALKGENVVHRGEHMPWYQGSTLLHAAANRGQVETVRFLLERGADPNARGGYDDGTPAHGAAWENHADVIRALARAGADLNLPSGRIHKNPPLGWAIVGGSAEAAEALVEAGVEIRDYYAEDAAAGEAGEYRAYSSAPPEAYARIREILEAARAS